MRILLAALAGAIGFQQMPNEEPVLQAMSTAVGPKDGLYIFPWTDPGKPDSMTKYGELVKTQPSGMLLYRGPGNDHMVEAGMGPQLIKEFLKQFVECLMAAWIVSMIALGFARRVGVVMAIGVATAIATNVSYWNWYGFPLDYTLAQMTVELVSALVAGLAMAAVFRWREA